MKKNLSKNKVQRMRNLVTGDYTSKTVAQSGYSKTSSTKKIEGDIWEERGKQWTIKEGIKQTITKLDAAREYGTYDEWQDKQITANFEKWLYESKEQFKDWLVSRKSKQQITEAGDIEDWSGGKTDEALIEEFDIYIKEEKQKFKDILSKKEE